MFDFQWNWAFAFGVLWIDESRDLVFFLGPFAIVVDLQTRIQGE